jgi:hypothetical protein
MLSLCGGLGLYSKQAELNLAKTAEAGLLDYYWSNEERSYRCN